MKKDTPNVKVNTDSFIKSLKTKNYDLFNRPIKSLEKKFVPPYAITQPESIETIIPPLTPRTLTPRNNQFTQCSLSTLNTPRNLISKNCVTLNFSPINNLKTNSSLKRNVLLKYNNNKSLHKAQSRNSLKIYDINKHIDLTHSIGSTNSQSNLNEPQFDFYSKKFVIKRVILNEKNNLNSLSFSVTGHRINTE
jgi:hypothetical protein